MGRRRQITRSKKRQGTKPSFARGVHRPLSRCYTARFWPTLRQPLPNRAGGHACRPRILAPPVCGRDPKPGGENRATRREVHRRGSERGPEAHCASVLRGLGVGDGKGRGRPLRLAGPGTPTLE